jgi:hypothetical protein
MQEMGRSIHLVSFCRDAACNLYANFAANTSTNAPTIIL